MLSICIKNSNPIVWLETNEYFRAKRIINEISKGVGKMVSYWDIEKGLEPEDPNDNPLQFLEEQQDTILVLYDYHKYINEVVAWRTLVNTLPNSLENGNMIIIVSPIVSIPNEIAHYVTLCKLKLPSKEDLLKIANSKNIIDSEKVAIAGLGLTEFEFKEAINSKDNMFDIKKQIIEKNQSLKIYNSEVGFSGLCGMEVMKNFVKKMVDSKNGKGILILGIPGGGKSEFAKRLGYETNRITISLDFGSMMGSYVGQTEQNTKEAFNVIDSINQSIVFIDEIEKGLSGVSGNDSGVSKRQGGQFLKWMQDKSSDTYVVATANDISSLPSEYLRSGRWDAIFFIDLPSVKIRTDILNIYRDQYNIKDTVSMDKLDYTGAEIETLCRLSSNLKIPLEEAVKYVCPIINTNKENIDVLRKFAHKSAVAADIVETKPNRRSI